MKEPRKPRGTYKKEYPFTLDQPVTRQIISNETGLSYTTVCRKLRKMDFVDDRCLITPRTYSQILLEWGYIRLNELI